MQCASTLLMIRPATFRFNEQTSHSNFFQQTLGNFSEEEILAKAQNEFDQMVKTLRENGIEILVINDSSDEIKPDALFPNNWISTDRNGNIFVFPMCTENRRLEKREDILDQLKQKFFVDTITDLSFFESENKFLEGTGSMVMDHIHKKIYAGISPRTNEELVHIFAEHIDYVPVCFYGSDQNNNSIYHTNVIMSIGERFAIVCFDSIKNEMEKQKIIDSLLHDKIDILEISSDQMNHFAGNMLQVKNNKKKDFLVMSEQAFQSLNEKQLSIIRKYSDILSVPIQTIETVGGGSARCMMAEIFLEKK